MDDDKLRRYTSIPALIYLLTNRVITLLDPTSWDDVNDSHYLAAYKRRKRLQRVLVLCFSQGRETYHHWRVFAHGSSGVCIRLHRAEFLDAVVKTPGIVANPVKYRKLPEKKTPKPPLEDLPFLKRYAFEPEEEFRLVWGSEQAGDPKLDIPFELRAIAQISLSPWMPEPLVKDVKTILHRIEQCGAIKIVRSTLINNERWKKMSDDR
ncbi:MAG TPA: hypothetical protein VE222_08890 [Nitrospiraceae bacterium]|jgi:hypothetical protein|nr:hypothetical protein [Nitrospiraceae bacterium]